MPGFSLMPELLAQLAAAGFRPPPPMQMPGFNLQAPSMQQPQQQGMSMGDGMAMAGLAMQGMHPDATIYNTVNGAGPEANISGFRTGGGPQGPSGGALAPSTIDAAQGMGPAYLGGATSLGGDPLNNKGGFWSSSALPWNWFNR